MEKGDDAVAAADGELGCRTAAALRAIAAGDAEGLSDAFCGCDRSELCQLLRAKLNKPVVVRRASSLGAVEVRRPTLLALAVARDDQRSAEFLASHGVGLDERLAVCDSASSELEYEAPLLLIAIMTGRLHAARTLVGGGASVDARSSTGDTALMEACFEGCFEAAEFLIKSGADVNGCNSKSVNGLMLASYAGRLDVVELLLRCGATASDTDRNGRDALFYSVTGGQLSVLKLLIQRGLRPTVDDRGTTILMEAAASGRLECLRYLIANMSALVLDLHSTDTASRNAAYHAAENNCLDTLRLLLDSGAALQPDARGRTALMCACLKGSAPLVHYLLDYYHTFKLDAGSELDRDDRSCLFYAATSGSTELLQRLLSGNDDGSGSGGGDGFKVTMAATPRSRSGVTLLMQAAGKGKLSVARYIVQRLPSLDIDLNARDADGWTALAYAAALGSADVVRLLVGRGASCSAATSDGKTVLMQAAQAGNEDLVAFLCEKAASAGLDVHACDAAGWNALYYALLSRRLPVFRRLLAHGLQCCTQPSSGVTLLMEAVDRGADDIARFLVDAGDRLGIAVDAVDSHGCNCLFYCAASGDVEIFKQLVSCICGSSGGSSSSSLPVTADAHGRTVLMQAAYNGHAEMTAYLMENDVTLGLDVNAKDKDGRNALFYCVEGGHLNLLLVLLEYGVPMQADNGGKNNLFQAVAAGHWPVVEYIVNNQLQLGLDLAAVDRDGVDAMGYYVKRPTNPLIFQKLTLHGLKVKENDSGSSSSSNLLHVLQHALRVGGAAVVRRALLAGPKRDAAFRRELAAVQCEKSGETVFHWAARRNDVELFEHFADVYAPEVKPRATAGTPLMLACAQMENEVNGRLIAAMLASSKADVNTLDADGLDALRHAVRKSNRTAIRLLLQCGARVACCCIDDSRKQQRGPPRALSIGTCVAPDAFMLAGSGRAASIAQMLLDATVTVNDGGSALLRGRDKFGRTALHYACQAGNSEVASIYLRAAPHMKDEADKSGSTPLMVAASWGHTQTVVNLLYHGADPNKVDPGFRTALHLAVDCHDPSLTTVHALCRHGKLRADVDARDSAGSTALMIAAGRGNILVVKCLLDCGANPIACDYRGTEVVDYCKRGDYKTKSIIKKYCEMPFSQWRCLDAKQDEYREVVDVTRILHMLQKGHVITPQLEAIVLADPSHGRRVERLLGLLRQRGRHAFDVFCQALRAYYPVLGYELVALSYVTAHMDEAPS